MPDDPLILIWATTATLLVREFTALFAAGFVSQLRSGSHIAIFRRLAMPRCAHLIVVGPGQVGLRLAQK